MKMKINLKKIRVKQIASANRRPEYQTKVLIGLGLNKMNRIKELEDTPSVRGMIHIVKHLVRIEE